VKSPLIRTVFCRMSVNCRRLPVQWCQLLSWIPSPARRSTSVDQTASCLPASQCLTCSCHVGLTLAQSPATLSRPPAGRQLSPEPPRYSLACQSSTQSSLACQSTTMSFTHLSIINTVFNRLSINHHVLHSPVNHQHMTTTASMFVSLPTCICKIQQKSLKMMTSN